jgi:hypothetical protein
MAMSAFAVIGISLHVNESLWAGAIMLCALLTLLAVGANYYIYRTKILSELPTMLIERKG